MTKNIEKRIQQLEDNISDSQIPIPGLIYITGLPNSETFEEAKAKYKQRHGFDLPENAPIYKIQRYDGRKKIEKPNQNKVVALNFLKVQNRILE